MYLGDLHLGFQRRLKGRFSIQFQGNRGWTRAKGNQVEANNLWYTPLGNDLSLTRDGKWQACSVVTIELEARSIQKHVEFASCRLISGDFEQVSAATGACSTQVDGYFQLSSNRNGIR